MTAVQVKKFGMFICACVAAATIFYDYGLMSDKNVLPAKVVEESLAVNPRCPNERSIIIPVYSGHFEKLVRLLQSVHQHVRDPEAVTILIVPCNETEAERTRDLIRSSVPGTTPANSSTAGGEAGASAEAGSEISRSGQNEFPALPGWDLRVMAFPALLREFNVTRELDMWKFPYQSLKKLYGAKYLNCTWSLEFDADSVIVKAMSFKEMFADMEQQPTYFYYLTDTDQDGIRNLNLKFGGALEGLTGHFCNWGYQGWFMERVALDHFFEYVESTHNSSMYRAAAEPEFRVLWSPVAFQSFVFWHLDRYPHYRFVNVVDTLRGFALTDYNKCFGRGWELEYVTNTVDHSCFEVMERFMRTFRYRFFRYHDWGSDEFLIRLLNTVPSLSIAACDGRAPQLLPTH